MWRLLFGVDVRSLALFRVCMGLVILYDLWLRAWDLPAHLSDSGVILRSTNLKFYNYLTPGLYNIDGSILFSWLMFFATFVSAICVIVGYKTKQAGIVLHVLLASLHSRNLRIGNGGDKFLRHVSMWSLFVPLNAVCSIDSLLCCEHTRNVSLSMRNWRQILRVFQLQCFSSSLSDSSSNSRKDEKQPPSKQQRQQKQAENNHNTGNDNTYLHVSFGSFALLLQTVGMYAITWYLKNGVEWTTTYYAVYLTLCVNQWVTPFGLALRRMADASPMVFEGLRIVTMVTPPLQIGTLLLFSPVYTSYVRLIIVFALAGFQLGLALCMDVLCVFPWATIAGTFVFLPPCVWEKLGEKICFFPISSAEKEKLLDRSHKTTTSSTSSLAVTEKHKTTEDNNNDNTHAAPSFSYASSWRSIGVFPNMLCALLIALNIASFAEQMRVISLPNFVLRWEFALQASQDWTMFSNNLGGNDGWYSLPSRFVHNGSLIDLAPTFTEHYGIPLVAPAPDRILCTAHQELQGGPAWRCDLVPNGTEKQHTQRFSGRWLELVNNNKPWTDPALFDFTDYLCRTWNNDRPSEERIALFEVLYVQRRIAVSGPGHPEENFPGDGWTLLEKRQFKSHNITIKTRSTRLCETRCQSVSLPSGTSDQASSRSVLPPK